MNKKIFTLLAGAFLMFVVVFSVKAQGPMWNRDRLSLGDTVRSLTDKYNPGYYHLVVDTVIGNNPTSLGFIDSMRVLYMGPPDASGNLQLFIDSINTIYTNNSIIFNNYNNSKALESAASLWCVFVDKYIQGKNTTFDFINKQWEEMLEVDVFGYENWADTIVGSNVKDKATHVRKNAVPGGVSGWEFSGTYATMLESRPLISYITRDTVAVLCMNTATRGSGTYDSVYVKIADATDVQDGKVDGVIYFRLMHAAPFVVDVPDYNTIFGKESSQNYRKLKFNGDVSDNNSNPFTNTDLMAEYLNLAEYGVRIRDTVNLPYPATPQPFTSWGQMPNFDTVHYRGASLDSLGYLAFRNSVGEYVQVKREYFSGNQGGNQFLKIELGDKYDRSNPLKSDSLFYGQYAFRMVYYPSGDSIYINPYQATYLPMKSSAAVNAFYKDSVGVLYYKENVFTDNVFTDSVTLSVFTYYADTAALQHPTAAAWGNVGFPGIDSPDTLDIRTARLKYGKRTSSFYEPYTYWHRLYVSLQDLEGATRLTLNSTANLANNTINTQINFGLYTPCGDVTGTGKTTVAPDVYLIRNTNGQYLQVPLYSATDSASWVTLDNHVDPRYVPSFHWVVEQRYTGSQISPVKITNREFEWLIFDNVQLLDGVQPLALRLQQYTWNTHFYNVDTRMTTDWANRTNNNYAFIKLEKEFKNDPLLGYTWIDSTESVVNAYAFHYESGIADTYMGWDGNFKNYPNTDTLVYVNSSSKHERLYFTLDTIHEDGYGDRLEYGFRKENTTQIADLVTLERQPYRLTYQNPFKYTCIHEFCMSPDEDKSYSITRNGYHKSYLGKPVFYLRHVYKKDGEDPYFALVQRIDTTTTGVTYDTDTAALRQFLKTFQYGPQLAELIMERLKAATNFNPGLFVAKYEDATSKLKMTLRADVNNVVSTFSLEKDEDPLYRRFNTTAEGENDDNPDFVHFYAQRNSNELLFENTGRIQPAYWANFGQKNYLGIVNKTQFPNLESHSPTTIYVDTAYVNRGTGYIKPQYLLAVRPQIVEDGMGCDQYGEPTIPLDGYLEAYYLINAWDSAYKNGVGNPNSDYLWDTDWTRLVFTRAIHANDYLYILGDADLTSADIYGKLKDGVQMFDLDKLHTYALRADNNIEIVNLGANNKHKDCVFSFRLVERGSDDFLIESETTDRDTISGPIIAPCAGGWLKEQNGVPVITRSDEVDGMEQALLMNVYKAGEDEKPTANDAVETTNVTVVGGTGAVTILNAAGKSVVINNILGQTVAQTVLTSDNQTIPASKGIAIVSIDGEDTVKTLVK